MSAASAIAKMMRPPVGALTAAGAAASLAIVDPGAGPARLAMIAAVVFAVTSGGFVINDVLDLERDRVTHPERPLPGGRIHWATALVAAVIFLVAGLAAALPLGREATIVVAANVVLLTAYSSIKTWSGVLANVLTAYLGASIALLGGVAGGHIRPLVPAIVFVFLANLARETVLDLDDATGDRAGGLRTAPLIFGAAAIFRFVWVVLAFLAVFFCVVASYGEVSRPLLFLVLVLTALALYSLGLRRYQKIRDSASFGRFINFGRWAFALSILGFLAGGLPAAAAVGPLPAPAGLAGIPPSVVLAYALAGVGLAFLWIANSLINEYNRESRQVYTRIDANWRFYSIFTCLNLVFFFQCLTFARSTLQDLPSSWSAVLFFVIGFIPFPVVWLELAYSKSSKDLGFTRYYEQNCLEDEKYKKSITRYYSAQEASRRKEKRGVGERLILSTLFFWVWLRIYLFSPLAGFQIRRNRRNPDLEPLRLQLLQTAQDFLVALTNWLFLFGLAAAGLGWSLPSLARVWFLSLASWAIFLFVVVLFASALLALLAPLSAPETPRPLQSAGPALLLIAYAVALVHDLAHIGLLPSGFRVQGEPWGQLETLDGGFTPWVLLVLLVFLIWNFLSQLREARRLSHLAATLADFALHSFANLLTPPNLALEQVQKELESPEMLARLGGNGERRQAVLGQVQSALRALDSARQILLDLQAHARRAWKEHWYYLLDLLKELEGVRPYQLRGADCETRVFLADAPDLDLFVDREAFLEVLRNMVENAHHAIVKAERQQGEVRLAAEYDREAFYFPLRITVWDNGTGILDVVKRRIFEVGFTTKPEGNGIGLFVTWDFVQRIQGEIDLETSTTGTTFTEFSIWVPADRVQVRSRKEESLRRLFPGRHR